MTIYIVSKKEAAVKAALPHKKGTIAPEYLAVAALGRHAPQADDLTYLDISGYTAADLKKAAALLKKRCKDAPWGIIDPKDSCKDPASWFFEGAADYMGSAALANADSKRFRAAAGWKLAADGRSGPAQKTGAAGVRQSFGQAIKLATTAFAGWNAVTSGSRVNVYLLYVSLQGKTSLQARFGEAAYSQLYKRFLAYLNRNLQDAEALLWMNTGKDCLFVIPPRESCANTAVISCLRMLLAAPLASVETLGLSMRVDFVFALHFGTITYLPPGKTGTVVSDAVNFIFHLGAKKAEPGRLTISGETPTVTIPAQLTDDFVNAGSFEGRDLVQSRQFTCTKS
ncbi:MAG: hypothetical protein LBN92_05125 [Treponema sp.]|jgi:class 3 adenylate cyclase|nr:hypothetical protein [Treponema sp.]